MKKGILKELRINRGVSQKEFAAILGVSQQTIASWEVGRTEPSNSLLKDIADYFNVSADYLLGRRDVDIHNRLLSEEQVTLLKDFDSLGSDGRNILLGVLKSLANTYPASASMA